MAARMGNLTALADSETVSPVSPEEALTMLDRLEEEPSSSQMMAALGHFKEALKGMDEISRELAREGAVKRLRVLGFTSPGRIVDAAMPPSVRPSSDTRGGGPIGFQDPDLWPEAVAGTALLSKLEATVGRYLALGPDQMVPFVLWILLAHAHEAFEISPILAITSPDKGCGKSTALALLSALVPRPLTSANITASAVFRVTDYFRPTLLLDEADTFITDSEGLRGILNSGHMRSQAYVTRVAGDEHRVSMFSTWTPKAIALIGELPATLADRSVMIRMRRRSRAESIERLQLHRLGEMEDLRSMAARWAMDHMDELRFADPELPSSITKDRARDNWRPLLSISDLAGEEWPRRARESASRLNALAANDTSVGILLLEDLRSYFQARGTAKLVSEEILEHLRRMEERPWPEWRDRSPLTARQLAAILHPFGISPIKWRQDEVTRRGYEPAHFTDAFSRYLPPVPPHPPQTSLESTYAQTASATKGSLLSAFEDVKRSICSAVADVADQ
jgi:hypothetical protein